MTILMDPTRSWLGFDARLNQESDSATHGLIEKVRDHMRHEILGNLEELMATLTDEPIYHFWGNGEPMVLEGNAVVTGFYQTMIAAGGNQFEVVVDNIIADHLRVVTEGQVKQLYSGTELIANMSQAGLKLEIDGVALDATKDADSLFLTTAQLVTVWPADDQGRLVGEDIYFGQSPLTTAQRVKPADINTEFDWHSRLNTLATN